MGGLPLFLLLYSSVQSYLHFRIFNLELAMQDFHPRFNPSLVLKLGIICTFLIHSGSLQKILTAFLKQLYKSFPILYAPCGSRVKHLPIVQNLNISLNFCARLDFNVIWFVKCMKIRPIIVNYLFIVTHPHRKNLPQNAA